MDILYQCGNFFIIQILTKYMINSSIICIPARGGPVPR